MSVHRELSGDWAECLDPENCVLRFHFPDATVEEMAAMPLHLLLPILNAIDPPQRVDEQGQYWLDEQSNPHRDYDLPAVLNIYGTQWWQHGHPQRAAGPSMIRPDGTIGRDSSGKPVTPFSWPGLGFID